MHLSCDHRRVGEFYDWSEGPCDLHQDLYSFKSFLKKIGKGIKKVVKTVAPAAIGFLTGGPVGAATALISTFAGGGGGGGGGRESSLPVGAQVSVPQTYVGLEPQYGAATALGIPVAQGSPGGVVMRTPDPGYGSLGVTEDSLMQLSRIGQDRAALEEEYAAAAAERDWYQQQYNNAMVYRMYTPGAPREDQTPNMVMIDRLTELLEGLLGDMEALDAEEQDVLADSELTLVPVA